MDLASIVVLLIVGLVAGWLAGRIMRSRYGLLGDLVIGVIGAYLGKWLFGLLGVSLGGGILGTLITAVIGAVVLLFVFRLIFGRGRR